MKRLGSSTTAEARVYLAILEIITFSVGCVTVSATSDRRIVGVIVDAHTNLVIQHTATTKACRNFVHNNAHLRFAKSGEVP